VTNNGVVAVIGNDDESNINVITIDFSDIARRVEEFGKYGWDLLELLRENGPMLYTHLQKIQKASPAKYKPVFKSLYTCGFIDNKPEQTNVFFVSEFGKIYLENFISESRGKSNEIK